MDSFKYSLLNSELGALTTGKSIKDFCYSIYDQLPKYYTTVDTNYLNGFKLITKSMALHNLSQPLPAYFTVGALRRAQAIVQAIAANTLSITYDDYIEIFKYHQTITWPCQPMPDSQVAYSLSLIIGSNPDPYSHKSSLTTNKFQDGILNPTNDNSYTHSRSEILNLITVRDSLLSIAPIEYTLINKLIANYPSSDIIIPDNIQEVSDFYANMPKMISQLISLKDSYDSNS